MGEYIYKARGVCSRRIRLNIDKGIIISAVFESGCSGNLQGLTRLVEGMAVEDVIRKLKGIDCEGRGTSCPDQLAKALEAYTAENGTQSKAI